MTSDTATSALAPHEIRVPILRPLEAYDADPDHVRGARYANLLWNAGFEQGDVVRVVQLEDVDPAYFDAVEQIRGLDPNTDDRYREFKRDPDLISVDDFEDLPAAFTPAADISGGDS